MVATAKLLLFSMLLALAGLALGLYLAVPWPTDIGADELDFGENGGAKSGGGEFVKYVPQGGRALIGKIPVGIKDLSIQLTASSDLDIELWDGEVFVVGWEANGAKALLYGETETTGQYNGVEITWSGWNGVDGDGSARGNESITLAGATKNTFLMKVFGYEAGTVKVEYSWVGAGINGPASSGAGRFSKSVPQNGRTVIGAIPAGVDGLQIDLTAEKDLDIELWDGEVFVAGWQVNGQKSLLYSNSPVTGLYRGVRIFWSGWDGVDGRKGSEYIRISGTTQNSFLMKVFGYQQGNVIVEYSWGSESSISIPKPTPAPALQPPPQIVRTWVGGFRQPWNERLNWSPIGLPAGDELIVISGNTAEMHIPIMNVDFTLTTGTINIGPVNSMLIVAEGVVFTNHGTVNAQGDLLIDGTAINRSVYNNEAAIVISADSGRFTNHLDGVLNNAPGGSSTGTIVNACGGSVNDSGDLGTISPAPCVWSEAGGNDKWSDPSNWVNGLVPPEEHPVVISGEGSAAANVMLDVDLDIKARWLTVGPGDTLTIGPGGSGIDGKITLSVQEPGGLLTNRGTVAISNFSSLRRDTSAVIDNQAGIVRVACRGSGPPNGVTGASMLHDPCFWDAGGVTSNWSEAANWDSDTLPDSGDSILVRDADGDITIVNLDVSFELSSQGSLTVAGGQTLNIIEGVTLAIADETPGGSIWIDGTLNLNGGTLHNQSTGLITNRGAINVKGGTLKNEGNYLVNKVGGKINNIGGLITNGAGAGFLNSGAVDNDAASNFILGGLATLTNDGVFTNAGLFNSTSQSGDFVNRKGGTLTNSGTMNLSGRGVISNQAGAKITNSGRINVFDSLLDNRGTIDNTGTVEIFHFGSFQNLGGLLEIKFGGDFTNAGSASNLAGSTINNAGSIINDRNLLNAGIINNLCGGTVTGPVNGNQPVTVCSIN